MVRELQVRFEDKIYHSMDGCWYWIGAVGKSGRPQIRIGDEVKAAHRVSYLIFKGEFDRSLKVCHHCDNVLCVNPHHLFLGTQADNMKDMYRKNRQKVNRGEHHQCARLTKQNVLDIRTTDKDMSAKDVAKKYGIAHLYVYRIWSRHVWQSV